MRAHIHTGKPGVALVPRIYAAISRANETLPMPTASM